MRTGNSSLKDSLSIRWCQVKGERGHSVTLLIQALAADIDFMLPLNTSGGPCRRISLNTSGCPLPLMWLYCTTKAGNQTQMHKLLYCPSGKRVHLSQMVRPVPSNTTFQKAQSRVLVFKTSRITSSVNQSKHNPVLSVSRSRDSCSPHPR